jgi:hypothetical protein
MLLGALDWRMYVCVCVWRRHVERGRNVRAREGENAMLVTRVHCSLLPKLDCTSLLLEPALSQTVFSGFL